MAIAIGLALSALAGSVDRLAGRGVRDREPRRRVRSSAALLGFATGAPVD